MARDRRDLTCARRRDRFAFTQHCVNEIADVIGGGIRLIEVLDVVQVDVGGLLRERLHVADELRLRIEMQVLAVHHFDGALLPHELLAVAVLIVAEEARVVQMEAVRILVQSAERVRHFAIVLEVALGPLVDSAGSHAGIRHGLVRRRSC